LGLLLPGVSASCASAHQVGGGSASLLHQALDAGALSVAHLGASLTIASGQDRLVNVVAHGEGADVGIIGVGAVEWVRKGGADQATPDQSYLNSWLIDGSGNGAVRESMLRVSLRPGGWWVSGCH
jgi:hypothetical protein